MTPMAIPATAAVSGTPASNSASVEAHTLAIEVDPLDDNTSDTARIVYGKVSSPGSTGSNARCASAPWPISRRLGPDVYKRQL